MRPSEAKLTQREQSIYRQILDASHAVQSGVKAELGLGSDDGSPKHLRTGLNLSQCRHSALVELLIDKGVIDREEYLESELAVVKREVAAYERRLSERLGKEVTLA